MTGGLYDPLGTDRAARGAAGRRRNGRPSAPAVAAGLLLAALGALLAVSALRDTGDRGQPVAVVPIEHLPPPLPAAAPAPADPRPGPTDRPPVAQADPPARADQDVEVENGVRVVRPRREAVPAAAPSTLPPPPAPPPAPPRGGKTLRVPDGSAVR